MKTIFYFLSALLFFSSCSLEQQYSFNEDFSGTYKMVFDLTEIAAFSAEDPDSVEDAFETMNTDSIKTAYQSIEGISNVEVTAKDNVIEVRYDFKDLDALNRSLQNENEAMSAFGGEVNQERFLFKNGVFKYNYPDFSDDEETDSLSQMLTIVQYNVVMNFAKTIESSSNGEIQENKKSILLSGNLGEVATREKSLDLEVTFK
jgi:hypothetical protein